MSQTERPARSSLAPWDGAEDLVPVARLLLESSAGTGKTWQIAQLATRLVAEEGIPVEKILVITFTNAAAAELRERIRNRLAAARAALDPAAAPSEDAGFRDWQAAPHRAVLAARLAAALAAFDLAPISTIHGFCQRTLTQLAFESGQEPGQEMLADVRPLIEEWLADELARLYAAATDPVDLALAADMGWSAPQLRRLAQAVTGAVLPELVPAAAASGDPLEVLRQVGLWRRRVAEFTAWLDSAPGVAAVDALRDECKRQLNPTATTPARHIDGRSYRIDVVERWLSELRTWLDRGAVRGDRAQQPAWAERLQPAYLAAKWRGGDLADFAGLPLFTAVAALLAEQDSQWSRAQFAAARRLRDHVAADLERRGALSYDTMLSRLAERAGDPLLVAALRQRYDVALVDEFQDTDAAQWRVLTAVFASPANRLLMIGDPKQAIYAFRGADVHVYQMATRDRQPLRRTMRTNWRSDPAYIAAMNHFWWPGSGAFGQSESDGFDYVEVHAAPRPTAAPVAWALHCDPADSPAQRRPLELRWIDAEALGLPAGPMGSKALATRVLAARCAAEAARLLATGHLQPEGSGPRVPVVAGDLAVLVRSHKQGHAVQRELARLGIAAVTAGQGSVLQSPVADWLLAWLDAVAAPGHDRAARQLAVTPLIGWSLRSLHAALAAADGAGDPALANAWAGWLGKIKRWAEQCQSHGFIRALDAALNEEAALERVLAAADGERWATDLRHLAELCHAEERRLRLTPAALATWLRDRRRDDQVSDPDQLRLESDARAVQIVTLHASKGLEYPIVLLPFCSVPPPGLGAAREPPVKFHQPDGTLSLCLAPKGSALLARASAQAATESAAEERRLLYVGLTRARHHAVVWLGPAGNGGSDPSCTALAALALRERDEVTGAVREGAPLPPDLAPPRAKDKPQPPPYEDLRAAWLERLEILAATSGGAIGLGGETATDGEPPCAVARAPVAESLVAARWPRDRQLTSTWMTVSYTGLASGRTLATRTSDAVPTPGSGAEETARGVDAITRALLSGETRGGDDGAGDDAPFLAASGDAAPLSEPAAVESAAADPPAAGYAQEEPPRPQGPAARLADLASGTEAGKWVHAVLEHLDFASAAPRDGRALDRMVAEEAVPFAVLADQHTRLIAGLRDILDTPLDGPRAGLPPGLCLGQIGLGDRLDELRFDLRLAGGAAHGAGDAVVDQRQVAAAMALRLGDTGWDGLPWLRFVLAATQFPPIAGILTGSIDLVFRHGGRTYFADYKTNRITSGADRARCAAGHFARPWLAFAMAHHGYHLQALLYTVAVHRFLRQRVPGYSYDAHFGGHLYLFLRGMAGKDAPRQDGTALGVYADRWPQAVILALDAALGSAVPALSAHGGAP